VLKERLPKEVRLNGTCSSGADDGESQLASKLRHCHAMYKIIQDVYIAHVRQINPGSTSARLLDSFSAAPSSLAYAATLPCPVYESSLQTSKEVYETSHNRAVPRLFTGNWFCTSVCFSTHSHSFLDSDVPRPASAGNRTVRIRSRDRLDRK